MSGITQYGDVITFPRTDPIDKVIREGVPALMRSLAASMRELGIPLEAALSTMQIYYGPAIEMGGQNHSDPLMLRERPDLPVVRDTQLLAWKVTVRLEPEPAIDPLVEGTNLVR